MEGDRLLLVDDHEPEPGPPLEKLMRGREADDAGADHSEVVRGGRHRRESRRMLKFR